MSDQTISDQTMSEPTPDQAAPKNRAFTFFVLLVVAALVAVVLVWFQTPVVYQESSSSSDGAYTTAQCANAGPSRGKPPVVRGGQEVSSDPVMIPFSLQVIKNDIESLRVGFACEQARTAHTNRLIVTAFAAGAAILVGYAALTRRRR